MFRVFKKSACVLILAIATVMPDAFTEPIEDLAENFANPPASARPWVYWFWLNGNITREGITADLEAMQRVGIGGALIMEVDQGAPVGPIAFMSPEWRVLFKHAVDEAQRLGLEINMNNDAGWNGSGGPWITPEQSMQKVVVSEVNVEGPQAFDAVLPQPETVAGFYRDIAVLAFPSPGDYRIGNIAVKACYQTGGVGTADETVLAPEMVIQRGAIVDLTAQRTPDGHLAWQVPAGKWTILRFGHTSTGVENAPSPATGRGLECDKLSKEGIEAQFNGMMGKLIEDVGPAAGKALIATHIDSWENGAQNWTARMREEFQARRGYDLFPFLPVLSGRVVDSLEISERFLWDFRQTISNLIKENYAGRLRELAQEHGMRLSIEAYGGPCDDAPYAGRADEPMGEFWVGGSALGTCKEMASAAHTYGKTIVGAESFTAGDQERWLAHPATLKALGDQAFCAGINRFVFHRYAMQPWLNRAPGMTMGPWGTHYERTETWWEQTPPWHQYLSRCQYMLRQGHFVADICYLLPEASPQGFNEHKIKGYDYDNCSAEVVINDMTVVNRWLMLPNGAFYNILVLPETRVMSPALLQKIKQLVQDGATVLGPPPRKSPGLTNFPQCDAEVKALADEIWGECDGASVQYRQYGKGIVTWGIPLTDFLPRIGADPDFQCSARLNYIHRLIGEDHFYFVANPNSYPIETNCTFHVYDVAPYLWNPENGEQQNIKLFHRVIGGTRVPISLEPNESIFVVFFKDNVHYYDALNLNGKPIISALDSDPKPVISKAVYGLLSDPQKTRDVQKDVQEKVDRGESSFLVSSLAAKEDPAPGEQKTISIEFTLNGQNFFVTGNDNDQVYLTEESQAITIEKAVYGVLDDPQRTRDVREKLQHLVNTGETTFDVARMAQGDDPAFMVVKTLRTEYTINGQQKAISAIDPDTITLALPPVHSSRNHNLYKSINYWLSPDAQCTEKDDSHRIVHCEPPPTFRFEAWQPGEYEFDGHSWTLAVNQKVSVTSSPLQLELSGPWELRFPPNQGAPELLSLDKLISWSEHPDPDVKHFSGTAAYSTKFNVTPDMLEKDRILYLDLGTVHAFAEVTINGTRLETLWKPPFRLKVTGHLTPGENTLEVKVTNLWINRMIGDESLPEDSDRAANGTLNAWPAWVNTDQPSPTGRFTFTTWRLWAKDAPLQPSGLLGPIMLYSVKLIDTAATGY